MYKKFFTAKLFLILGFALMALVVAPELMQVAPEAALEVSSSMANPAAVYCGEMGYIYEIVRNPSGEVGDCLFPDGDSCDAWEFLQGKCGQNYSYCALQGYDIKTVSDGKDPFSQEYAVCVSSRGEEVGSVTKLSGLSEKSMGCGAGKSIYAPPNTSEKDPEDEIALQPAPDAASPSSFDWRNILGCDWMTSIKDQGGCGSCWAFSAAGAAEAAHNIAADDVNLDLDLSEQYLVSDCYTYAGYQTCCGGYKDEALAYIRDSGIPDEGCFPYTDGTGCGCLSDGTCSTSCTYDGIGVLNGGIEDRIMKFTWIEPGQKGPAVMIFTSDGEKFFGLWWYEGREDSQGGIWNGTKKSEDVGGCPHWGGGIQEQMTGELLEYGRVRLYGINFDYDSDVIRAESKPTLDKIVAMLKSEPTMQLIIEGHTDSDGTTEHNQS